MNKEKFLECERKRFNKMINYRLPKVFMTIGLAIVVISITTMFIRAFALEGDSIWLKELAKKGLLIGMLLMSVSRDKEEDEMTVALQSQSYAMAMIGGVVYALVMPYVEFGVSNMVNSGGETLKDLGDFQVLLFMLMIQLMFYHILKRNR